MKLAKLSLAAIVIAGLASSSFAADTLAGAFKEGKVSGTIKSMYRDVSVDAAPTDKGFALGGELGYVTGSLNGFTAGVTFQTSHTLGMQNNNPLEVDTSVATSKTTLSEAYIAYNIEAAKTVVKVGRQYFDTPLASSVSSRMFNDSFQAVALVNTYFANTTLVAATVNQFQSRFADFASLDNTGADKYIHTLYANNKSIAGLELTAQATFHKDERNLLFVDAAYDLPIAFPLTVGAQYLGDYSDTAGEADSYTYGLMVGTKVGGFGLSAYYNSTDSDGDVSTGYGQGTDWTYNSVQYLTGIYAGQDSYQGKISYDFAQVGMPGLSAFVRYAVYDGSVNPLLDGKEWNLDVSYKFAGAAKGLEARVRYADINYDAAAADDGHDFRVMANYKF